MYPFTKSMLVSATILSVGIAAASAAELKQVGTITVPGEKLTNFDISFIDQAGQRYYFADRSNKSIDILDVKTDTFVDRVGGFVGVIMKDGKRNNDTSGPDGVLLADDEIWAGDGDSTVATWRWPATPLAFEGCGMTGDRTPIISFAELDSLDMHEVHEGYRDGKSGDPEPGGNRSKSYWHGWRNGLVDGGHAKKDGAQAVLAASDTQDAADGWAGDPQIHL